MPNPLNAFLDKAMRPRSMRVARRFVVGIAQDLWKDGTEQPFGSVSALKKTNAASKHAASVATFVAPTAAAAVHAKPVMPSGPVAWNAQPGEISEKMWGEGSVTPADDEVTKMLTLPLGLNKDLSVLDISAGLGGRLRAANAAFQVYITGLEPDAQIAARGMELSIKAGKGKHVEIAAYDPANFSVARRYDCIIARETFYRVADRGAFFTALASATKPGAQISFTDYVINPEHRDNPAIKAFMAGESNANPASVVEMAEAWAKVGFKLRVLDDQTDLYMQYVLAGLRRFAIFMGSDVKPDAETKQSIVRHLNKWVLRIAALQNGMKFYRFYGTKM
jgi:SAM-dependent methyltransferase